MASDNEHNEIGLNVANVPLDLEKEDGELSTYSFDSVTSTPLSLALSQITINGAESPFTDVSSLHQMILEEEEKETNTLNELEQEKNKLLKQIESELEKKKKKTKKNKGQLLKEIAYLKQVKNKIKHSEKKGKIKKKKSKKKTKSKIRKRRNSVVGIAQQEHIAQQDDGIPNTLNDENCEDDRLFPSLHEVRTIIPTEINNDLKVTIIGSAKPEKVSRIDEKEPIGTSHYPHSKSKRKKSSDSRNKSPKFSDEIECCSNERSESGSDECLEIEKSPMKSHHARHRIGHPTDTRLKRKTKSKSPNRRRQSRDEDRSNKKYTRKQHTKSKSPNRRRHSRDEDRSNKKHTKSKSPNQRRHSRDEDGSNKKYHYEEHLRRKSSHSDPDSGYPGKRHPRHRSSSSSSSLSSSSGSSANSEHSVKFIDFLVKSVIRNKEVVELSSRTSSSRGNSPASDNTLPLHLNTTSTFFNPNYHHSSTITPASPEIHIIGKVVPTNTSIAIDINRNEQSIEKEPSEPIIIPPSFPEESVPEGERNFSSLLLNFPFTSKDIPNHYDNDVPINSNINLPVPAPLSHHSEDNLSNYNVMSMETESLYDPFETSTELSDDVANITVVEGIRGRKEMMEANMVRYQSGVDNTTRNKANLITITSVENNAIETPLGQSGCNSNSQTVIEQIKTGQKEPENNTDLNNDQLKKRQSIDSENTLNEQEKSDTENSQLVIVKKISRSETALDNTRSVKENHGNETDSENAQLGRGKHTSETDKSSQKMHQTIANKTSFKDAQSTEKYLETIETTQTMKDFLDNATVGANTQFGKDKPDVETIMNQESDTVSRSVTYDNHRELDIDLGLEDELGLLLPNMEHRDICIYQLDMDCLLQNPEIPDFVANGVAEFFAELQRVLCIAAFSKNVKNDDILCIEKWFVIINSVYLDLIYLKNQYTFVKMVKYEHVLNVILDHFQDCVDNAIKMYAEVLPQYIKHIEVIRGWLNSHIDKKKMLTSSADQYGAKFFEKNKRNIKNFLFERVQKLQRRLEFSNVGNNCRPVPQPIEPCLDVIEVTNNIEGNNCRPVPQPIEPPCLDVFEVTNNIEGNNCCPVPQPSKPYQDVFEVTNKIEHMLILKDGPKCYEMFEKISLDTLEHLLNKIKQELQDSEAEVYVTKCKELINEKIRITTLKEYIEKMYKSYVVQNNIVLNHIAINNIIAINNDLKSWKSTSSLKQKIKEILLKQHEGSFVTKKVEANAIKDVVEIAKPAVLQATQTDTKDSSVEMVKPTIPQIAETLNKDGSFGIVKPIAIETHKKYGSIEIVTHKNNAVIEVVKQTLPKPTVSKPIVSNATETFQNNEFVQIGKPTLLATIDTHKKNYHVDIVKLNGKSGKKDNANKTLEPTVSNVVDSHKKRDSVDGVKSMFRETKNCDISPTNDLTNSVNDSELPNKNPNKSNAVNLDESGNIPTDLNASVVFLGNEFSEVKDPRIRRKSINIEPDSLNSNVNVQVDESIVYKLIPLDVFIPFVRARNHLASYSKREEEAKDKGELFKPDLRLEKDKLRLKQEIQEELALSETIKEGSSRTEDKIPKDVVKIVDPSVKVVKAGIEKTSNSATKKCNTEDLVIQVKCKDPRLEKRDVGLESNTNPKNVSDQDKSNKKEIALPDNPLSSLPLLCNQIIEASCANVQLNKENHRKEAGNIKEILENKLTINTGLDSKHSKLHSILKTTKRDVLQSDSNNIPCEHNRSRNFLQQKIDEIGTSLKPKASSNLKPKTEQLKPDESNSWNRIPFQCSQNNENLYRKIQYYKIPKISRAIKTPSEKNMSELWIPKAKETNSENSMKPSEPKTEKDNNLKIECDTKVLKTNKEIDSGTDTKNSQPKIETSHTLQVDRKMTDIDNPSNVKKNTENASPAVKEFTPVKDKPKHTDLKKKRNKQTSETTNHVLLEKISKLERDMLDSKNDSEKIDVKNITGNDKLGPNYKVIDLFGDTPKSLKNKRTATENKDGKIKNSGNNGSEEGKGKSKENNEGIVIEKPLNKSKDNPKIMILKTLQSGNESVQRDVQYGNESVQRDVNTSKCPSSNYQFSKNHIIMEHLFMKTPYLKPFRGDSKLFDCCVLLDQISDKSGKGILKRKINSSNIDQNLRKKKRIDTDGKGLSNAVIILKQTNVPKHNENTDEHSNKMKIKRKSTHEVEQCDMLKKGNNIKKQKESNDSLCVNKKSLLVDTHFGENELVTRINKDELKQPKKPTEKKMENWFPDESSTNMEKRSNTKNEESSLLSSKKVDNSKIMEKVQGCSLDHDIIKGAASSEKAIAASNKFDGAQSESIERAVGTSYTHHAVTSSENSESENVCSVEHHEISSSNGGRNNEKENLTTDENEEVQFIKSINNVTKKRDMLKKKVNVKQAWERMREHVAKSKLSMLSTTAIATIDLEQPSLIEKESGKMIVENNAPKAIFLKRYSLDSNVDRNERKLPIKLNLRRCSEDTWEKVKEKEFDRAGVLNMLEQRKQKIEKDILHLRGHLGSDADGVEDSERSNISNTKDDSTTRTYKDILKEPAENQIHSTDSPMYRNKKSRKTSKGKFNIENFIKDNVEK